MTKNYIVKELINEMKERIPPGQNLANYLTDTLYMGKEAVYRRLRGEVAFTFDEIAVISHNLGIPSTRLSETIYPTGSLSM